MRRVFAFGGAFKCDELDLFRLVRNVRFNRSFRGKSFGAKITNYRRGRSGPTRSGGANSVSWIKAPKFLNAFKTFRAILVNVLQQAHCLPRPFESSFVVSAILDNFRHFNSNDEKFKIWKNKFISLICRCEIFGRILKCVEIAFKALEDEIRRDDADDDDAENGFAAVFLEEVENKCDRNDDAQNEDDDGQEMHFLTYYD